MENESAHKKCLSHDEDATWDGRYNWAPLFAGHLFAIYSTHVLVVFPKPRLFQQNQIQEWKQTFKITKRPFLIITMPEGPRNLFSFLWYRLRSSHLGVLRRKKSLHTKMAAYFSHNILPGPFGPRGLEWFSTLWQLPRSERVLRWGIFGRPPRTAAWHRPLGWWVSPWPWKNGEVLWPLKIGDFKGHDLNHPKQPGV